MRIRSWRSCCDEKRKIGGFAADAEALLRAYAWPGNMRELQNAVKHGAALATGPRVTARRRA